MIELRLSAQVLGNTTFAYSPLGELASSLRLISTRRAGYVMQPWLRQTGDRLRGVDLDLLHAVCPPGHLAPAFLFAGSPDPRVTIEEQLGRVAAMSAEEIEREVADVWRGRVVPEAVHRLLDREQAAERLAAELHAYWEAVITPFWPRLRSVIDDDVSHRATQLLTNGLYELLADLHPEVTLHGTSLTIDKPRHPDAFYPEAELTLIPSVFLWPELIIEHDIPGHFKLVYPARGVARVWENGTETDDDALGALLGRTRAAILACLDIPATTTQLAGDLGQSPATVSAHLSVLRRAGLLTSRRSGRHVLYRRTPLGASVVAASELQAGTG